MGEIKTRYKVVKASPNPNGKGMVFVLKPAIPEDIVIVSENQNTIRFLCDKMTEEYANDSYDLFEFQFDSETGDMTGIREDYTCEFLRTGNVSCGHWNRVNGSSVKLDAGYLKH